MTPIDHGDVCLNVDRGWFANHGHRAAPALDDLAPPRYRELARRREPGDLDARARVHARNGGALRRERLADYWSRLRANGVLVVDGWEEAYTEQFSGAAAARATGPSSSPTPRALPRR